MNDMQRLFRDARRGNGDAISVLIFSGIFLMLVTVWLALFVLLV